ncbi:MULTISPECIES: helix-turn-helix transcriptional regulator [unclassified Ruegeria]|uniref:helix-turn-helix transcriptional regulator n=1 Tax=unclassified Ruegeria TaxID=2625375 RepID=UPI0014879E74|nr:MULTISPECIES: helix-turn-helix transcriptional regulator [unclassified Ruegeria]NOD75137.1 helix-turn-helix domain-containing protein [Ruegeria sp. HKCCD4332]NOD87098.1 helix-turn-helix domain-containing protein [Ruegeria sp. HKCCD4318]NOE12653.1 helix-turn-helix domain-containing protein [Ruegeria sp. HKCCD4318-2]NOG09182.1 helix-turn-helix transcriptional regulator [Ruegeria sp. HKCCD4315]
MSQYLTTRELADLLRIGERKAYDLASSGEVPCVRAMGKLLFPRTEIIAWLNASRSGPQVAEPPLPPIVAGSHDPLLDWALRESGSGLATYYDGSFDGLTRLSDRTAQAAVLHIHEDGGFNTNSLRDALGEAPVVLCEIARRERGLLLAPGISDIKSFQDLRSRRVILRQDSAASQRLFEAQLEVHGLNREDLDVFHGCARTEEELAIALHDQKAEAGFGLGALAGLYNLGFVPTHSERLDLAIWRRSFFDPPMQKLMTLLRSDHFTQRAREFGGYDLSGLGTIHHNGVSG